MSSKEKDFGAIVELLKKDYLLKSKDNLKQELAKVAQDFVSRGLYNSTVCTGKQLKVHFDHLENLFNYIIESLKKDFANIPLSNFKEKLFTIVDEEYKKLVPVANSHLVSAGLAQPNILKSFETTISNKKEKTRQTIETKCAILEKQKATPKDKRKNRKSPQITAALIIGACTVFAAIVTSPLWLPLINKIGHDSNANTDIHPEAETSGDSSPAIPELKTKSEQSIEIVSDISQQDLNKKLIDIRTSKNLRKLIPLETGKSISETPAGTYFFASSSFLRFPDGDVEDMLKSCDVSSYKVDEDYFKIHKMPNGQVIILGYVGDEIGAALSNVSKSNRKEITLFPSPSKDFQNLVMIPISRIFKSNYRVISSPENRSAVLDVLIE